MVPLALLGACGGEVEPAANQTTPVETVRTPISTVAANGVEANRAAALPAPAKEVSKPLVSRETPSSHAAPPDYRAIGTEPFWAVTVRGSVATLERPDKASVRFAVSRNDDGRAIRYLGDGFSMTLTEGPCSDGMSDTIWSDRVQVAFGEGTLKGCGGERDDGGYAP
ncbi:membrane-like protein [Sphingobium sp. BYY-5]|uniref:membrane-like protein n=1 Tax=Sphingobium sp. BYY-5 TaxID=2926400 RepID=UPI001FA7816E|nr:membrane-like protein [Sphingobium sp. BYY-5]MCI4590733.1 membrane-like protein [Sphingobium sp. BYY-5]